MMADLLTQFLPGWLVDGLGAFFVFLLVLAMLVSHVIQLLKTRGAIPDGEAGRWSAVLSNLSVVLTFLIVQVFGLGQETVSNAREFVEALMLVLSSGFLVSLLAKLYYVAAKFIGMFARAEDPLERLTRLIPDAEFEQPGGAG